MKDVSIYVVAHKEAKFPKNEIYKPIQVGKKESFTSIRDNTGINIAEKNGSFCELTAAYWIWKNDMHSDIVGLTHYRRYFFQNKYTYSLDKVLTKEEIEQLLEKVDIILPIKSHAFKYTVEQAYNRIHEPKDLQECRKVIEELHPEYIESFDAIMKQKDIYLCNMFISSKKIFQEYYEWLFEILLELEKRIDISNYSDYNKRIYGFLSERLLNVWLHKNQQLKIKQMPVYNTDQAFLPQYLINTIGSLFVKK